jgi:molybdenum cofactor cytidylyltransferase
LITAIVLAAGLSRRMGTPKMTLPWGGTSVLGHVLGMLQSAGIEDTMVVTGAARAEIEAIARNAGARSVHNDDYAAGEMLSSLQVGLLAARRAAEAALVVLGDQPSIQESVVRGIVEVHQASGASLVVPSFQRRRGHPWLMARAWWEEVLAMRPPQSLRDFLNIHAEEIRYLETDSPSVLQDLDTPEDYRKSKP